MSPIYINNKKIESIYTNNQSIGKVYVGDVLVFQKNNYTGVPFIFTIDTTKGTGNSFNLPLRSGYNYEFVVDWGDGQTSEITSWDDVNKTHTYATGDEYQVKITGTCEAWYFDNVGDKLKLTSIDQWGNTGFKNMDRAFYGCRNLTTVNDTDGTWCSNVTDMSRMFWDCRSLTTLDVSNWDVSKVTNMYATFSNCYSLEILNVSNWDVSNVGSMYFMFGGSSSLETLDVSNWDVSYVHTMYAMFNQCSSLTTLDVSNWDVSNVRTMYAMFQGCSSLTPLDVSDWDVSNVSTMYTMFSGCSSLTTLDVSKWNVSKVTNMYSMFNYCSSLTTLDVSNWNISAVTDFSYAFNGCDSLTSLDASAWVMSSNLLPVSYNRTFSNCGTLDLKIGTGWNFSALTQGYDASSFLQGTNIGSTNYDSMLIIIASQPLNHNVTFGAGDSKYTTTAVTQRNGTIARYGWTIIDGGIVT